MTTISLPLVAALVLAPSSATPSPTSTDADAPPIRERVEVAPPAPPSPTLVAEPVKPEPVEQPSLAPALVEPDPLADPLAHTAFGCRGSKSCVRMTATGITLGSLGLAGVIAGATLTALTDQVDPDQPIYVTSTRPAGLVTLTLSAGVALTAVLMLVAARRGLSAGAQRARVQLGPAGLRF